MGILSAQLNAWASQKYMRPVRYLWRACAGRSRMPFPSPPETLPGSGIATEVALEYRTGAYDTLLHGSEEESYGTKRKDDDCHQWEVSPIFPITTRVILLELGML